MSGEAKHTEGPWVPCSRGATRVVRGNDSGCVAVIPALATEGHGYMDPKEREANAHLIAAAPDLLEVAKAAFYSEVGIALGSRVRANGWQWPEEAPRHVSHLAESLRAALSKATEGKDPSDAPSRRRT